MEKLLIKERSFFRKPVHFTWYYNFIFYKDGRFPYNQQKSDIGAKPITNDLGINF